MLKIIETSLVPNHFLWDKTLMHYHQCTISTWSQTDKAISAWIHRTSNRRIKAPVCTPFLMINHPTTLEYSTLPTKNKYPHKNCTQLDSLPSEILHKIDMWHAGLLHHNKLKQVLVQFTQHPPVLCAHFSEKLKYSPFDWNTHYDHIKYAWVDRRLGPYNYVRKWGKQKIIKHEPI